MVLLAYIENAIDVIKENKRPLRIGTKKKPLLTSRNIKRKFWEQIMRKGLENLIISVHMENKGNKGYQRNVFKFG